MSLIDRVSSKQPKRTASPRPAPQAAPVTAAAPPSPEVAAWEEAFDDEVLDSIAQSEVARPPQTENIMSRIVQAEGTGQRPASPSVARKAAAKPEQGQRTSQEFALNFDRLSKFGFITPQARRSRISEEFRLIKRRLMQRMTLSATNRSGKKQRGREHVILVTSARPSEGKSFVAMNLALSIVLDEGLNVMLVDGDVARPSISKILGLRNDLPGLTDLLLGDSGSLPEVMLREERYPMSFLAAGAIVPSATDLFGGDGMRSLVTDMASRYSDRIIIFDAPPLLASTEPVALAEHAGQIVMVIDAEKTSRTAIDSALDLLETDRNVNLVLNKTSVGNRTEQFGSYYEAYNQVAT